MRCTSPFYRLDLKGAFEHDIFKLFLGKSSLVKFSSNGGLFGHWNDLPQLHLNSSFLKKYIAKIPCGHCMACLINRRSTWATRLYLESTLYDFNLFLTLTYSDLFLPFSENSVNPVTGEVGNSVLVPEHVSSFMKLFRQEMSRKYYWDNIRFYACGEYGDNFDRPHYHFALFNLPIGFSDNFEYFFTNPFGTSVYRCPFIENIWKKGFVTVEELNSFNSSYVARYVTKKLNGDILKRCAPEGSGLIPRPQPFCRMSNRPGIAAGYYSLHRDEIYQNDLLMFNKDYQLFKSVPPRYFDKLYDAYDSEGFEKIKRMRKSSIDLSEDFHYYSEPVPDRLRREEEILKRKENKKRSYL